MSTVVWHVSISYLLTYSYNKKSIVVPNIHFRDYFNFDGLSQVSATYFEAIFAFTTALPKVLCIRNRQFSLRSSSPVANYYSYPEKKSA